MSSDARSLFCALCDPYFSKATVNEVRQTVRLTLTFQAIMSNSEILKPIPLSYLDTSEFGIRVIVPVIMDGIFGNIKTEPDESSSTSMRGGSETPSLAPAEKIVRGTDDDILQFDFNVSSSVDPEHPRKKQRVIMEVVVPTVHQLRKKEIKELTPVMKLKKLFKVWVFPLSI